MEAAERTKASSSTSPSSPSSSSSSSCAAVPRYNTKNLGWRFAADLVSALTAGALVAPVISIIDRSIMENASGRAPSILASVRCSMAELARSPRAALFSRPTALILLLYGGTYTTANALDTCASTFASARPVVTPSSSSTLSSASASVASTSNSPTDDDDDPRRRASAVSSGPAKFLASSAANVGLCVFKDRAFVRMFSSASAASSVVARPVPLPCYALFTLRDCITIFASFNLPPLLAPYIDARTTAAGVAQHVSGLTAAQFLAPAAVQLFSTPVHLLGLDLYNRPGGVGGNVSWTQRWRAVCSNWLTSAAARVCRIVPAFGVGGVVNLKLRQRLMLPLE